MSNPTPVHLVVALLPLVIWLCLWLARGRFWEVEVALPDPMEITGRIAVIIPARNEAESIAATVTSLLGQKCAAAVHIFVVDDESKDGTADIVRETARAMGKADAVMVVAGRPLPVGWTGKLWAVQQGIEAASGVRPDFLLFTDADITHAPDSLAALVTIANEGSFDLTSFMVKLRCESLAEKLLIPSFVFFFFQLYPPRWIANPRRATAGAAGGCILIRPEALARAGGIAAIRGEIIDDCALARAVKNSGGRVWLGLTPSTYSTRCYETFASIGQMISRTAFKQLRHSALLLVATLLGLILTYILPVALVFAGYAYPVAAMFGVAAWALMALLYWPMIRFYGLRGWWSITLPAAALFYMSATLHSAIKFWSRRGGEWKGRVQDPQSTGD